MSDEPTRPAGWDDPEVPVGLDEDRDDYYEESAEVEDRPPHVDIELAEDGVIPAGDRPMVAGRRGETVAEQRPRSASLASHGHREASRTGARGGVARPAGVGPGQGALQMGLPEARDALLAERARLSGLRDGVQRDITEEMSSESAGELSRLDQHPADLGTETFDRERDLSLREGLDGQLQEVEDALARLEAGSYGRCEACGKPIPPARLAALPATRYCLEDQAGAEGAPQP